MRRNDFLSFNPHKYEEELSPLGRQVLKLLINRCLNDREHDAFLRQPEFPAQDKVLNFRDSNNSSTPLPLPTICDKINVTNEINDEQNFEFQFVDHNSSLPSVPTSVELVKALDTNITTEVHSLSRDNLIKSALSHDMNPNIVHDLYSKISNDKEAAVRLDFNATSANTQTKTKKDISWDDMFDAELLPELDKPITEVIENKQNYIDNTNDLPFLIHFPKESKTVPNSNKTQKRNTLKECKETDENKLAKRRNQTKITDTAPKKVKNVSTEGSLIKNNCRKQKYTKTVKNWLNGIDPKNAFEEDFTNKPCVEEVDPVELEKKDGKVKIAFIDTKGKSNKKVIQAQLANKDGVMKFAKPKIFNSDNKSTSTPKDVVSGESPSGKDCKEKKTKPKFVAPIKSQIPVEDITYTINSVDDENVDKYKSHLCHIQNKKIPIVLLYSNGFCQLNYHHTDDTCIPEGVILDIDDTFYYVKGKEQEIREILSQVINNNSIICYEGKNVLGYLMSQLNLKFDCAINIDDVKIGGGLIDPDHPPENFSDLQKLLSFSPQYMIATECVLQKAAWYITRLKECALKLRSLLMENSLWNVFVGIEMRLLPIITDMELRGVCVDLEKLKSMETILLTKLKMVEQECYKAAGKVFQINSTVQVRAILYDELQLDTKCNIKIKETISKGAKSTSESMLRNLISVHALPKLVLEYRHLHKAHATFLTGIAQHIKDGVVKPTWVQTAAATGRIASNNPNLQAIPKAPFSLIIFPETDENYNQLLNFRSIYTSRVGYTLLAADFRHIECRVFAHAAADTGLLDALRCGNDLFRVLAAKWLKKAESEISSEDRERTKRIVYASLYGAGTKKLMDILDISYDQALSVISSFHRTFPSLKSFGRSVVSRCEKSSGRLATLCGRVRYFKNISSADFALKSHAERQAVNFVVQGSAADLCKMAMVLTQEQLKSVAPPVDGHLVLQIHDELVWEVQNEDLQRAALVIKEVMEGCGRRCGIPLPLPVALSSGRNWGEMTEFTPSL